MSTAPSRRQFLIPAGLALALASLLPAGVACASQSLGGVEGWSHGAAPIHMMRSDAAVGRIDADGSIHLDLREPAASQQTAARTFARCEGLEVADGEAVVAPVMLFVNSGQGENYLFPATSPEIALWQASFGETALVEGAWLQWIHASAAAQVVGTCATEVHTASSGELPAFEERVDFDVRLKPGWNLVRQAIEAVHEEPDGTRHVRVKSTRIVDAFPADMRWYSEF